MVLAAPPAAFGDSVYKWVAPDGTVTYGDRPQPGAEEVKVPSIQTYSAPAVPQGGEDGQAAAVPPAYEEFRITQPGDDESLRDNAGNVMVEMELKPNLASGHSIDLVMDGRRLGGSGQSPQVLLSNVDRGSHTLQAVILDAEGKELARSNAVTFHLLRVLAPRPRPRG